MSYCRWSSEDFQCDVYAYESVHGGFSVHVAGNRVVFTEPLPEQVLLEKENILALVERNHKVMKMVDEAKRLPIGLPHDGEDFFEGDASACADRLESLKTLGYRVPQYAIDSLREEAAEGDQQ
ncbi:hypothetical protein H8L49_28865 [Klebsiella quasipneumoniae]|uniref:hypothetical protein n=1 Tax=Klebsiella quasipneumoniae TaxID=1463165 RepID=UPI00164C6166|nr:hypothetical protein [Klebsiella quasipneumoniae]MBC4813797.1 hypothetical protein [Klebsiella quasipneumoniae]